MDGFSKSCLNVLKDIIYLKESENVLMNQSASPQTSRHFSIVASLLFSIVFKEFLCNVLLESNIFVSSLADTFGTRGWLGTDSFRPDCSKTQINGNQWKSTRPDLLGQSTRYQFLSEVSIVFWSHSRRTTTSSLSRK